MSKDILLYESGNGGEWLILNNDVSLVENLFQQAYICLFGGNIEASTRGNELPSEIRQDYWANSLLFSQRKEKQFNSETERIINETPLNSSGRIAIERAVQEDLKFMKNIADISINVIILSSSKLMIEIRLRQPDSKEDKILQILWENSKVEVILEKTI